MRPVRAGYAEFEARPVLGGLKWMEGRVPTPQGDIYIYMDAGRITVRAAAAGGGWVWFRSEGRPEVSAGKSAEQCGDSWRVWVNEGEEVTIKY